MDDLPVTLLIARLRPERAWRLPAAPGSTVRSALLASLHHALCLQDDVLCAVCRHPDRCTVTTFWHSDGHRVAPWWLSVATPGRTALTIDDTLEIRMGLAGPIPEPGALPRAWLRMASLGLGPRRVPHRIESLVAEGSGPPRTLVRFGVLEEPMPEPGTLAQHIRVPSEAGPALIRLDTPYVGKRRPDAAEWLHAAIGRVRGLARSLRRTVSVRWPDPPAMGRARLERIEAARRSRSHPGRQDLSGWVGQLQLAGHEATPYVDLLAAAEVLGVGRSTTFGMGSVSVDWEAS